MKFTKGNITWNKGIHQTEEVKRKLSESHKGLIPWMKGKHHTEETKNKISESKNGCNVKEETKRKISKTLKGKIFSEETKQKLSKANKGKIPWIKGKHHSIEARIKISETKKGKNNPQWKGGITSLRERIEKYITYRQWRSDIFTRDDFTCQECGQRGGYLHAHHIKSFSSILQFYEITTLKEALNCEELWNINNGITLCVECHKKTYSGVLLNA